MEWGNRCCFRYDSYFCIPVDDLPGFLHQILAPDLNMLCFAPILFPGGDGEDWGRYFGTCRCGAEVRSKCLFFCLDLCWVRLVVDTRGVRLGRARAAGDIDRD